MSATSKTSACLRTSGFRKDCAIRATISCPSSPCRRLLRQRRHHRQTDQCRRWLHSLFPLEINVARFPSPRSKPGQNVDAGRGQRRAKLARRFGHEVGRVHLDGRAVGFVSLPMGQPKLVRVLELLVAETCDQHRQRFGAVATLVPLAAICDSASSSLAAPFFKKLLIVIYFTH
jgi:hypothetical protein